MPASGCDAEFCDQASQRLELREAGAFRPTRRRACPRPSQAGAAIDDGAKRWGRLGSTERNDRRYWAGLLLPLAVLLTGCNVFSGIDHAIATRGSAELLDRGRLALESGNYSEALTWYERVVADEPTNPEAIRGYGESVLGAAGFVTLTAFDRLQNQPGPNDTAAAVMRLASLGADRPAIAKALTVLHRNPAPTGPDRLVMALARLGHAANLLRTKYDTNRNGRLDGNDEIDDDTNDATLPTWPQIFRDLVESPTAPGQSLHRVCLDLIAGLDGRGPATWTFILAGPDATPRQAVVTAANRDTILAAIDFEARLREAHPFHGINNASFASVIERLDGVHPW